MPSISITTSVPKHNNFWVNGTYASTIINHLDSPIKLLYFRMEEVSQLIRFVQRFTNQQPSSVASSGNPGMPSHLSMFQVDIVHVLAQPRKRSRYKSCHDGGACWSPERIFLELECPKDKNTHVRLSNHRAIVYPKDGTKYSTP